MAIGTNRFEQIVGKHQVEHGGFIDDDHVGVDRILFRTAESLSRLKFQQPMYRFGLPTRRFGQPFCRPTRRRSQRIANPVPIQQIEQGAHGGCFTRAGTAGEDGDFVGNGRLDGEQLLLRQLDFRLTILD